MRFLFVLLLLAVSQNAFSLPITCHSLEKTNGFPNVKFKINDHKKHPSIFSGVNYSLPYIIGITYFNGNREIVYATGSADENSVGITLMKDEFVLGSIIAKSDTASKSEIMVGTAQKRKNIQVRCIDTSKESLLANE